MVKYDPYRNPNMNNKDHRVGLLATGEANPPDDNDHVGKEVGAGMMAEIK